MTHAPKKYEKGFDILTATGFHKDYKVYFDKCQEHIKKFTTVPYSLYVKDNTESKDNKTYAQNYNELIKKGNREYVVIVSDDVLVFKNWDKAIMEADSEDVGLIGLCSNCDTGDYHGQICPVYTDIRKIEDLDIEYVEEWAESLWGNGYIDFERPLPPWGYPKLKFYLICIPRRVIDSLGYLDEQFRNCFEDDEYSYRVWNAGLKLRYSLDSYCWHFIEGSIRHNQETHNKNYLESFENWKRLTNHL